jgi:hypothetical protein
LRSGKEAPEAELGSLTARVNHAGTDHHATHLIHDAALPPILTKGSRLSPSARE